MTQTIKPLELIPQSSKPCTKCGDVKPLDAFSTHKDRKDGRQSHCRDCQNSAGRKDRVDNPERHRGYELKRKYGILLSDVKDMEAKQGGKCFACDNDELVVDHCHSTGNVRGLLCTQCNTAIGMVKDNTETLRLLIEYLEKHNAI